MRSPFGDTDAWLEGIAEAKIADFAGEAMAADAAVMRNVAPLRRLALLACMVHVARTRARDDLAEMFCKRMAQVTKLAKAELAEIREHQAEMSERLITNYRSVLGCLDPRSIEAPDAAAALRLARRMVEDAGGFEAQLAEIEAVSAHHANNYMPPVARLPWEDCEELLEEFCTEAGLPSSARALTDQLRTKLTDQAATVDAGYPENTGLVIDRATGVPSLKRRRVNETAVGAMALEEALKERMPERTLLEILARTAYWLEWWRRFGPASGSDPKLADPLLRYVLTTFTYGCNLGPAQAAPTYPWRLRARARRDRGAAFHDPEAEPRERGRRQRVPAARLGQGVG